MAKAGSITVGKRTKLEVERPERPQLYEHVFLIVCEDSKTEPYYFKQFEQAVPERTLFLWRVGTGLDQLGVVEEAIKKRTEFANTYHRTVDETWVVFDKDDADQQETKTNRFQTAIDLIAEHDFKLALSNEVFELWLLLHLADVEATSAIPRADIYSLLANEIRKHPNFSSFAYTHGKTDVVDAIRKAGDEKAAIKRAERLASAHHGKELLAANPSTQMHLLVQRLRELIAYYSWQPEKKKKKGTQN